jgi:type IV conjugative transfer system coupling protein TraD
MGSIFESFTQGGQTEIHKIRMMRQVIGTTFFVSTLIATVGLVMLIFWHGWKPLYYLAAYNKAYYRNQLKFLPKGFYDSSWIKLNNKWTKIPDRELTNHWYYTQLAKKIRVKVIKSIYWSTIIFGSSILVFTFYWIKRGSIRQKTKIIKGYQLVTPKVLKKQIKRMGGSKITFAGIPLPLGAESEHIMITGTTGSGKTNAINGLLQQIKLLGQKAIIIDSSGGFVSRFFDPTKDRILNPFDQRSCNWDLWQECNVEYDFEEFSESLIPHNQYDQFWTKAAQQLFSAAAFKLKQSPERSIQELLQQLLIDPLNITAKTLQGTAVSSYLDQGAEKTALSIRATLVSALQSLKYLNNAGSTFSIKNWLKQSNDWLFLSALPTQRAALKPLMSAWLSIAVKALMGLGEERNRRVWFIIDELAALNNVPILTQALAELRKFGGCCVIGFQDLQQLEALYGVSTARTLGSLTGTKLVFRLDNYAAKQMAELFGSQEILEPNRSISFGAHQMRDGVSLAEQRQIRYVASPTDLMRLDNLEAFIKFPRNLDVSKLKFKIYDCREKEPSFLTRDDDSDEVLKENTAKYSICLMSVLNNNLPIEKNKLYLHINNNNIEYKMLGDDGKVVDGIISQEQLMTNCNIPANNDLQAFNSIKDQILNAIFKKATTPAIQLIEKECIEVMV